MVETRDSAVGEEEPCSLYRLCFALECLAWSHPAIVGLPCDDCDKGSYERHVGEITSYEILREREKPHKKTMIEQSQAFDVSVRKTNKL